MEAKELRIGNYVYAKNEIGIVTALPMGLTHSEWNINVDWSDYDFKNIKPIPLTEEWLLKFGFKRLNNNTYFFNDYYLEYSDNTFDFGLAEGIGYIIVFDLKHVHQIQNLYFALTGEELTIK